MRQLYRYTATILFMLLAGRLQAGTLLLKLRAGSDRDIPSAGLALRDALAAMAPEAYAAPLFSLGLQALHMEKTNRRRDLLANGIRNRLALFQKVVLPEDYDAALLAGKLSASGLVEYCEIEPERKVSFLPDDPLYPEQYYLGLISAPQAWDLIPPGADSVIVAIVDTGVETGHPDLAAKIWINEGETGPDAEGNDKSGNGKDDDGNGYTDDWRGWDFKSGISSSGADNDPNPGNSHGTHVAGIIGAEINNTAGIAGAASRVRLMALKCGEDNASSKSMYNQFEAIMYAALMGADVINCSWGGTGYSAIEQEMIDDVTSMGVLVVGAAGNDGQDKAFYPASYGKVLSVASTDSEDKRSGFSNYHRTVDIAAPGSDITSTVPPGAYQELSGTSMAAPMVSGAAAMLKLADPSLSPEVLTALLKANSDDISSSLTNSVIGKLGAGRLNIEKALSKENKHYAEIAVIACKDENNDGEFMPGESVEIVFKIKNMLAPVSQVAITSANASVSSDLAPVDNSSQVQLMESMQEAVFSHFFRIPESVFINKSFEVKISAVSSEGLQGTGYASFHANPSYKTLAKNDISITLNNIGNYAFNDYPNNTQGRGMLYKLGSNLLYEGGLIIGTAYNKISNSVRGAGSSRQDRGFYSGAVVKTDMADGMPAGFAEFRDRYTVNGIVTEDSLKAGVKVLQNVYQSDEAGKNDFVISTYDIINERETAFDSLYVALFFDWDLGANGAFNRAEYKNGYGIVTRTDTDTLPFCGAAMVSSHPSNFFAIDNNGTSENNPGIYNGFTKAEKWKTMRSGLGRTSSSIGDVSFVVGAGPIVLPPGDTTRISFLIFAGGKDDSPDEIFRRGRDFADTSGLADGHYNSTVAEGPFLIYPNPAVNPTFDIIFYMEEEMPVELFLADMSGKTTSVLTARTETPGYHKYTVSKAGLAAGAYFAVFKKGNQVFSQPVIITR